MLKELVNYANWLKKDFPDLFEGKVTEGLHIAINVKKKNGHYEFRYRSEVYRKGDTEDKFLIELSKRETISKAIYGNKQIMSKGSPIFSNNPYSIFFKLYFSKSKHKDLNFDSEKYKEFINKNFINYDDAKRQLLDEFIKPPLKRLFEGDNTNYKTNRAIVKYYEEIQKKYLDGATDQEKELVKKIREYTEWTLKSEILIDPKLISMFIIEEDNNRIKFEDSFFDKEIRVNFLVDEELLRFAANRYFSKTIFVKSKYNKEKDDKVYGLPSFFNKVADEKIFNLHKTSFFKLNRLVEIDWALILNEFLNARENLPNPLPIFIDKDELNEKVVILYKEDTKRGYKEIITDLARAREKDLGNYYLLNFTKGKINDFDFVSSFNFKFGDNRTYEIMSSECKINSMKITDKIEDIFDIEDELDENFLFKVNRKTGEETGILKYNYFTDKIKQKGNEIPSFVLNNIYKYRKTLYDAIYKSRLYLITPQMIKEICEPTILYEIYHDKTDEKENNRNDRRIIKSKNEYLIIKKLISYFNLNRIFDKENKNTGGIDMPSKLPEYYSNLKELLEETFDLNNTNNVVFKSDEDFAFSLGQLIKYLLEQSESSNKNHSMLVPFLQKLNSYDLFMNQLVRTFKSYSYKIKMRYRMFDRLMANVMGYKLEDKKLRDLEMVILSGYFADSVIRESMKERNTKSTNDEKENTKEEKNE